MRKFIFPVSALLAAAVVVLPKFIHAAPIAEPVAVAATQSQPAPTSAPSALPPLVRLKFTIKRNGLVVAHPETQIYAGQRATVMQQEAKNPYRYKIEVTPILDPSSAIRLDLRISEITDQETTLLSNPTATVFPGDSTDFTQKKAFSDELKITITPSLN